MFTGIVQTTGRIRRVEYAADGARLNIACPELEPEAWSEGDSISVSGVCLTALEIDTAGFSADLSTETLQRTTLGRIEVGDEVNLEPALRVSDRLGGHLVSGHVDAMGEIRTIDEQDTAWQIGLAAPDALMRYIAPKGSVALDGVSLTINHVRGNEFSVSVIPHTRARTTLGQWRPGAQVNLEIDLIARYLERLAAHRPDRDC